MLYVDYGFTNKKHILHKASTFVNTHVEYKKHEKYKFKVDLEQIKMCD